MMTLAVGGCSGVVLGVFIFAPCLCICPVLMVLSVLIPLFVMLGVRGDEAKTTAKMMLVVMLIVNGAILALIPAGMAIRGGQRRDHVKLLKSYVPEEYRGKVPRRFFNDGGAYDYWRFALVYPYEMKAIDTLDTAWLSDCRGSNPEIGGDVTALSFDGQLMVAEVVPGREQWSEDGGDRKAKWIVFEFASERRLDFRTKDAAMAEAKRRGFSGGLPESVRAHYERFEGGD